MGRTLLAQLIDIAKEKGLKGFVASVLPTNKQMLSVFHTCGRRLKVAIEDGVYELSFRFDEPD